MSYITNFFRQWWVVILIIAVWQTAVSALGISQFLLPGPASIVAELVGDPVTFLWPLLLTLRTAAIGLVIGVGSGYLMASLAWMWPVFGATLTPFALVVRTVPFVALIPVLTKLFGYSDVTAWLICAMVCFFPTFVLVRTGLSDVPANGNDLFDVVGASRATKFRLLAVPSSTISLATSLRISASSAFAAALISEFLMGTPGLAAVLSEALDRLNMTQLWGAAACAIVVGIGAYLAANRFEKYAIARWS